MKKSQVTWLLEVVLGAYEIIELRMLISNHSVMTVFCDTRDKIMTDVYLISINKNLFIIRIQNLMTEN